MAIRRQKLDRKVDLTLKAGRVVDMAPGWSFIIDCPHHGKLAFDFNPYRKNGRDELAEQMRDAIWNLRHEVVGRTLNNYQRYLRHFWEFLETLEIAGESITCLYQIDRAVFDRYLAWVELQVIADGKGRGQKWSVGTKKKARDVVKALLVNRQKRVSDAVNPGLSFPLNPYPNSNRLSTKRDPYSASEQKRILEALNRDLREIHEVDGNRLSASQVLAVHVLLLGLATGRNLQSLLELRRDSLQEHPISDRELLVTYKRRGWMTHATSIRKTEAPEEQQTLQAIPSTVGDHFRYLCTFTAPLIAEAAEADKQYAFLWRKVSGDRRGQVVRLDPYSLKAMIDTLVRRHGLTDDQGKRLALNVARTRPTFATELYRRTRDIRRVQKALGHASPETTARHYAEAPLEAERDHAIVLDGMVSQFARMKIFGKVLLAADGKIPQQGLKNLLSGNYNTGIARCKNPFREDESVCKKFFACFRCPSLCVFEDDLWRLFSFYYRILSERSKINPGHWLKTYGPIIRRIDVDIASQFPSEKVEAARKKAIEDPHPTWRGPLL